MKGNRYLVLPPESARQIACASSPAPGESGYSEPSHFACAIVSLPCSNPLTCELPGLRWCLGELWLLLAASTSPSGSPGQGEAGEEEAWVLVPIGLH